MEKCDLCGNSGRVFIEATQEGGEIVGADSYECHCRKPEEEEDLEVKD